MNSCADSHDNPYRKQYPLLCLHYRVDTKGMQGDAFPLPRGIQGGRNSASQGDAGGRTFAPMGDAGDAPLLLREMQRGRTSASQGDAGGRTSCSQGMQFLCPIERYNRFPDIFRSSLSVNGVQVLLQFFVLTVSFRNIQKKQLRVFYLV